MCSIPVRSLGAAVRGSFAANQALYWVLPHRLATLGGAQKPITPAPLVQGLCTACHNITCPAGHMIVNLPSAWTEKPGSGVCTFWLWLLWRQRTCCQITVCHPVSYKASRQLCHHLCRAASCPSPSSSLSCPSPPCTLLPAHAQPRCRSSACSPACATRRGGRCRVRSPCCHCCCCRR